MCAKDARAFAVARARGYDGEMSALVALLACGVPMDTDTAPSGTSFTTKHVESVVFSVGP